MFALAAAGSFIVGGGLLTVSCVSDTAPVE